MTEVHHFHHKKESWIGRNWHPLCGMVYILICLTDFLFMPVFYQYQNAQMTPERIVELTLKFDGATQIAAINVLSKDRTWQPITLEQSGLFHLAFGAILGVGAWARGQQKIDPFAAVQAAATQVACNPPPPPPPCQIQGSAS